MQTSVDTTNASLGKLLRVLWSSCPTLERQPRTTFAAVWSDRVNRPYCAEEDELVDLMLLNREVAALCRGPLGDKFRIKGARNSVRVSARLGEPWETRQESEFKTADGECTALRWLRAWNAGEPLEQLKLQLEAWSPREHRVATVRDGCSLLVGNEPSERLAQYAGPRAGGDDENTLLGYVRRLVRLRAAEALDAEGERRAAVRYADEAGLPGKVRSLRWKKEENLLKPGASSLAEQKHAGFLAYRCRRLAERCQLLGCEVADKRYRAMSSQWQEVSSLLGGTESC